MKRDPLTSNSLSTRLLLILSGLAAIGLAATFLHDTLVGAVVFEVKALALGAFVWSQVVIGTTLGAFGGSLSRRLARRRRSAAPALAHGLLTLPLVSHIATWICLRGLLEDTRALVRGGAGDGRLNLSLFVVGRVLCSPLLLGALVLGAAAFSGTLRGSPEAWLSGGATAFATCFAALFALTAAVTGVALVRRLEMRFHDAELHDSEDLRFSRLLSHTALSR